MEFRCIDDGGALTIKPVYDRGNATLVSRDLSCGINEHVALMKFNLWVEPLGDLVERGGLFALRARYDDEDVFTGVLDFFFGDDFEVGGYRKVAQFACEGHVGDHGASADGDFSSDVGSGKDERLKASDIRGEERDEDAAIGLFNTFL